MYSADALQDSRREPLFELFVFFYISKVTGYLFFKLGAKQEDKRVFIYSDADSEFSTIDLTSRGNIHSQ